MIVQATFIGRDGSLGYKKGQQYLLLLKTTHEDALTRIFTRGLLSGRPNYDLTIERTDGSGVCPYTNIDMFFQNWSKVSFVGREGKQL